jgi:hypothetical protein
LVDPCTLEHHIDATLATEVNDRVQWSGKATCSS